MSDSSIYYRPQWTCGRYDKRSHTAIMYNLIEGVVYSFIDASADVVGVILSYLRNTPFDIKSIISSTGILGSCVQPFVEELLHRNLITIVVPSQEGISNYRRIVSSWKKQNECSEGDDVKLKLPMAIANAEMEYSDRVGGVTSVMFEMTYRCPEMCIHCYNPGATRNSDEISHRGDRKELCIDDYKRIVDELYEEGLIKVCLSGGDPFSNEATWKLIDYLYQKEIAVDIFTNGLSIQKEIKRLADYYPRLVGISIYSGDPEEHDRVTRIKGSWSKSILVANGLADMAVPLNLKCCVMRPTLSHYYEVDAIAKSLGAKAQFETSLTDSVEGDKCVSKYLRLSKEQMEIVLRDRNVPLYVGKEAPNYGSQEKLSTAPMCGAAFNSFCVTPEGDFIPCCSFHLKLGNVREQPIKEIIENSSELKNWRKTTIADSERCGKEEYCSFCNLCPGMNYSEHSDYLKPAENNCWMAKVRYNLANKMKAGYDPLNDSCLEDKIKEVGTCQIEKLSRVFDNVK